MTNEVKEPVSVMAAQPPADDVDVDYTSSRVRVLEAIQEMHSQDLPITTPSLMRVTGLRHVTVSDCLKALRERGKIWSPERGIYRPVLKHPPARAVSRTSLPDGTVKLEVGDDVLTLTPRESRMVAEVMGGTSTLIAAIESVNQMAEVASLIQRVVPTGKKAKPISVAGAINEKWPQGKQLWTDEAVALLGTMLDSEVAQILGCAESTVGKVRRMRGIRAYSSGRVRGDA